MSKINATVSIETISVEQAKIMLEDIIEGQRKLRETAISRLAEEMRMGRFMLSSDAVLLIKEKLANGQHRLAAVVQSGLSQQFLVMRTRNENLFEILDCGVPRNVADVLAYNGFDYPKYKAAIAKLIISYDKGILTRLGHSATKYPKLLVRGEIIEYARLHNDSFSKTAQFVDGLYKKHKILAPSLAGALIEIANRKYPRKGMEFMEKVYSGGSIDDAAFDMRERLIQLSITKTIHLPRSYMFALLIKSFMLYVNGKRAHIIKIAEGEEYPTIN